MMKKSFSQEDLRINYLKKFISYHQFLEIKSNVIFGIPFNLNFNFDGITISVRYRNVKEYGNRTYKLENPSLYFFYNNISMFSIFSNDFKRITYSEFIEIFLSRCSNNFVEQLSMGEYL